MTVLMFSIVDLERACTTDDDLKRTLAPLVRAAIQQRCQTSLLPEQFPTLRVVPFPANLRGRKLLSALIELPGSNRHPHN